MSRNTDNHFGLAPMKSIGRSSFKRPCIHSTTFNTGELIPFYTDEVLPGDTCKMKTSALIRMTTPIYPVMDNAWLDTYYFFVPRRLLWEHWEEFMGENKQDAWTQTTEYTIPQVTSPEGGWIKGTIAEKILGNQKRTESVDAMYFRCYATIFNEWFRNENVTEPAEVPKGDATTAGSNGTDYVVDLVKGGMPAKAVKYADYFTRALPEPQKGPDVYLPLGKAAPVKFEDYTGLVPNVTTPESLKQGNANVWYAASPIGTGTLMGSEGLTNLNNNYTGGDLVADLSLADGATINQLRQAFAVQRMYEVDARGGTRYTEILRAHFGVVSPDSRLQRPEYLGGKRTPINITQVIQQSATNDVSPQGTTAAYSLTIDVHEDFTKSFTEHGIIMGICVIRTEHTYQQGLERRFSRKDRTDFYFPELSNIGEQGIKNKEIFIQGNEEDEEIFGYQEAWAEYRYSINKVTGELNSDYEQSLDSYHYADDYIKLPTLSDEWIRETDVNVARTLAIQNQDQWIANFYFDQTWIRPMPIYSIPQLTGWN